MAEDFICVTGQDGEVYEVRPTDALLHFLQRMAEDETQAEAIDQQQYHCVITAETCC